MIYSRDTPFWSETLELWLLWWLLLLLLLVVVVVVVEVTGCRLVAERASNNLERVRDGSALMIVHAATLRHKLLFKLAISPSHGILTSGQPVPPLT